MFPAISRHRRPAAGVTLVVGLAIAFVGSATPAFADVPTNDNYASATPIAALPFAVTLDDTSATTEASEPSPCYGVGNTVWYTYDPAADETVRFAAFGGDFFIQVTAFEITAPGFAGLAQLGDCASFQGASRILDVQAGHHYAFQVGSMFGVPGGVGMTLDVIPPPTNDAFASAEPISAIPFGSDLVNARAATLEPNEPMPSCFPPLTSGTVWWQFTSPTSELLTAESGYGSSFVAVYTGTQLSDLTETACGGLATWLAEAGTTYYLQGGHLYGDRGDVILHLDITPPPTVGFNLCCSLPPSRFDNIQFYGFANDPGGQGIATETWSFGDGGIANGCCPTHQWAGDGTYTVQFTATTTDGRSATSSQEIVVRTDDVAVTKLLAPTQARAGKAGKITVGISNHNYPETVQVALYRSTPGGGDVVATLTVQVPVSSGRRTTDVVLSYTFTAADAALGKITFLAVASIQNFRDALPIDNELIAPPTKVTP